MAQLSLFETGSQQLLDDASGSILLIPELVDHPTAQIWFSQLQREVPWKGGRRQMYEREVEVPRLRAYYRLDATDLPSALAAARIAVANAINVPFDSVGLNLYRDQHDSVAPHNDKLEQIVRGQPIALLSLGAMRRMTIRAKHPPRRVLNIDLQSGSLLVMSWSTQLHYDHAIPKANGPVGPRISVAFRVRGNRLD